MTIERVETFIPISARQLADAAMLDVVIGRGLRWLLLPRPQPRLRERLVGWQWFADDHGRYREAISWRLAWRSQRAALMRRLSWRRWVHDHVVGTHEFCD